MPELTTIRLLITGRVQGVGYRDWLMGEANRRQITGWVRNVGDQTVEAVMTCDAKALDNCLRACWAGPPFAKVENIVREVIADSTSPAFVKRPSIPA